MEVAGVFLGPIFQVLLDKLASRAVLDYARRESIHLQLEKLKKMLLDIHAVLADAEQKKKADGIKLWMDDLTDLALDLDDLLDELDTDASRLELKQITRPESEASSSSTSKKVRKLIPTRFTCFAPPSAPKLRSNMMSKVEEITTRFQDIEERKRLLKLIMNVGENRPGERPAETTSLVVNSHVCGRENEKKAIVELLLKEDESSSVSVIPIVGMGGIGKTTLAQLVYHDERLKGHFVPKAWVCVSDHYDVFRVTKAILDAVTSKTDKSKTLNELQEKLKQELSGKKFLLVLDDVWTEKYEDWELLQRPFMFGAPGSKIIVTTRHGNVALTMSLSPGYPLKELSGDECLSLLAYHALNSQNFDAHPHLKGIGEKIVRKCKGLPLAVKALAGLLRTKQPHQSEWVDVLNSEIWEQESNFFPALMLSYHHLPSHLKQCFAYCATFPKDYEFDKAELVLLWMGVGLLQQSKEKDRMEDFGNKCFNDLFSRSFFQESGGSKSKFVMHDILHDLAIHVAGKISVQLDKLEGNEQFEIPKRARHLSFVRQKYEVFQKFRPLCKVQHLRTLLALPLVQTSAWEGYYLANKVLFDLLPNLQCLRVLSLSSYSITELPDSIGHMKHLRYLNLSQTSIRSLPESVSTLYNLQTLLLRGCKHLCMFPPNTENLINLRHIDIVDTVELREMSSGIGRLKNLQTLPKFVVGSKNNGARLNELGNMSLLRGSISIEMLQNITNVRDANEANLRNKECLNEVELAWCSEFNDSRDDDLELDVLDTLQPHVNLKRLKVEFFGGREFPSWIGNPSFSEMVNLSLIGCRKCRSLPPLQQLPKLRELYIEGMHEVQNLGDGLPFPSLETLKFEDMPAWKEWSFSISIGVEECRSQFPCLRELSLRGCPNLITVSPLRLPSLQKLYLEECEEVVLKSIVGVTSLTSLKVVDIRGLSQLEEALVQSLVALESLVFKNCNQLMALWQNGGGVAQKNNLVRLQKLGIESCPQLVSFGEELDDEGLPCINVQKLYIRDCVKFEKMPNELNKLTSLTSLEIDGCSKLVCFPKAGVPHMLRRLEIRDCNALMSVPEGICGLKELKIERCLSLSSWPTENMLPTTLKDLSIDDCVNLEDFNINNNIMSSLETLRMEKWPKVGMLVGGCVNNNNFDTLSDLRIWNCDGVESLSFPERGLPNLRELRVWYCVNLRSLPTTNQILQNLESLSIVGCPSLEAFPERGCCLSTPYLRSLYISGCKNLRWLPIDQIQSLASLESIRIEDCPCLGESFNQGNGNGNLPPNLVDLSILGCGKLKPLSEWSMHRLTSLQELNIEGGYPELVSFPPDHDNDDYCLFPTTLQSLWIMDMKSISLKGLQNLTSLQFLRIQDCPNLKSISSSSSNGKGKGKGCGLQNFTSLQSLWIVDCPKLRSLPKEGLPATLQSLNIWDCPLLEKQFSGDYGPMIAHIPCVRIKSNFEHSSALHSYK